ncbi:c-type cytochrome domain-containing protein [Terriglobus tenax]|uniref:c-type cytochrome domain-containing protein n=1 Tax=Terriglobus tenax TaxID=1111115 RepID=UPI0021E05134|nr:c-type cytochrome domain-containing protein [Terriglobus tenax]
MRPALLWGGALLSFAALLAGCEKPMTPEDVTYRSTGNLYVDRVQPILQARCYRCHAGLNRESGLRVDSRAYMLKGGKHGTALVPGDPEKSLLIQLVRHEGPKDDPMPMPNRRGKLPEQEIRDLERWVKEGANE